MVAVQLEKKKVMRITRESLTLFPSFHPQTFYERTL
jgi:hypothetical protein